jgi:hypothetical protein
MNQPEIQSFERLLECIFFKTFKKMAARRISGEKKHMFAFVNENKNMKACHPEVRTF